MPPLPQDSPLQASGHPLFLLRVGSCSPCPLDPTPWLRSVVTGGTGGLQKGGPLALPAPQTWSGPLGLSAWTVGSPGVAGAPLASWQ